MGVVTLSAGCANVTSFAHRIRAMTRSCAGERAVAREPRRARSWVRLTIVACVPGIGTLQSVETRYSYANCQKEHEYYQSAPVSRQIVGQTRLPSALRHKGYFAYQCVDSGRAVADVRRSHTSWRTMHGVIIPHTIEQKP